MFLQKKQRYKPLYKKFLRIRFNVQVRRKFLKLKKLKWKRVVNSFKGIVYKRRRNFKFFDQVRIPLIPFRKIKFKRRYSYLLIEKQKTKLFYGQLTEKNFKKIINQVLEKQKTKTNLKNKTFFFIELFESRLDSILYRAHFAITIRNARQLISHGRVFVNKTIVKNKCYRLKLGDCIEIDPKFFNFIEKSIRAQHLWPIPPRYLHINYKIFQIVYYKNIKFTNISFLFPFYLKINKLLNSYDNRVF